ncbi:MAG: response regulator [Flavipsychrobacter sp.]|nr:response regulator [Flavipsychrobacter sp.]
MAYNNKKVIMIAEDDADDRYLLQAAFEDNGFMDELIFVENGIELLDHLNGAVNGEGLAMPDLILLDLNMPKKDGREALREIKENDATKRIPVVIFSTTNNKHEIVRCYDLGVNSYITKPNSFEQLVKVVMILRNYWLEVNRYS